MLVKKVLIQQCQPMSTQHVNADMENMFTYQRIDKDFVSKLPPKLINRVVDHIATTEADLDSNRLTQPKESISIDDLLVKPNRRFYFMFCPYCNEVGWLSMAQDSSKVSKSLSSSEPVACVFCGETGPFEKMNNCQKKSIMLYTLATGKPQVPETGETFVKRTLLEQSLVTTATGIEVFLRDVYSIVLNLRHVKPEKNLTGRFIEESRNDFINIGKAKEKYKKDLGVDLARVIRKDDLRKLDLLMAKRNVVVHNNGTVDRAFLRQIEAKGLSTLLQQTGKKLRPGARVPVSRIELEEYLKASENCLLAISRAFELDFREAILQRIKLNLKRGRHTRIGKITLR